MADENTEDLTPFQVRNPREVAQLLAALSKKQERMTLLVKESGQLIKGTISSVNNNDATLIFEPEHRAEADGSDNEHAPLPNGVTAELEGTLDSVKIAFSSNLLGPDPDYPQRTICSIPDHLIRLQRREYYRVHVPSHPPVRCRLNGIPGTPEGILTHVKNLSSGGLMLHDFGGLVTGDNGTVFRDCLLELPAMDSITCSLKLCNRFDASATDPTAGRILGMQFVSLSTRSLSVVQRYAAKLEVSQRSVAGR